MLTADRVQDGFAERFRTCSEQANLDQLMPVKAAFGAKDPGDLKGNGFMPAAFGVASVHVVAIRAGSPFSATSNALWGCSHPPVSPPGRSRISRRHE